jgi:serine-type D-Ala-D-Ala carboxypeptidase (penicillin-binding protein 5/6)
MVVNGWPTMKARTEESERLLEWAFREFGTYVVFKAGQPVDKAPVWLGKAPDVSLVATRDVAITIPRRLRPQLDAKVAFDSPDPGADHEGAGGRIDHAQRPGAAAATFPLTVDSDVEKLGFTGRIAATVSHYVLGRR